LKVDNETYHWVGNGQSYNGTTVNTPAVTNLVVTPTRTTFILTAGTQMRFNVTFLSPITPGDFIGWSTPFSYISIDAQSLDGSPHSVKLYSDISGGA